jgi:hypothetical protein
MRDYPMPWWHWKDYIKKTYRSKELRMSVGYQRSHALELNLDFIEV